MMKRFLINGLAVLVLGAALTFSGCGGSSSSPTVDEGDDGGTPTPTVTAQIELGALVYATYYKSGAGFRTEPADDAEKQYSRCKGCHGWDRLANQGGYWNRSDGGGTRPAGKNVSTQLTRTDYTVENVQHAGGRALSTLDEQMPDYSDVLSSEQVEAVTAFLNYEGGQFSMIGTVTPGNSTDETIATYTFPGADIAAGRTLYEENCLSCHVEPGDVNLVPGDKSILDYLGGDGKFSELAFKAMWGAVDPPMTRMATGEMDAAQVRDVMAYLQSLL